MKLETERLILRAPEVRDVDDYMEFRNSEFVLRYNAMALANRDRVAAQFAAPAEDDITLLMECKELGKVIGAISVEEDSIRWGVASKEVSYFISEAFCRKGYMKEALTAVIAHLFREEGMDCVAARAFSVNTASRKLLASLGFHQNGEIPRCVKGFGGVIFDDTIYSMAREEFMQSFPNGKREELP